jgi:AcrR family transcriptional regulator
VVIAAEHLPARSHARRQAILEAAQAVFLAHGVAAASMEEIRDRSGASIGSIYHHFRDKEGIAEALHARVLDGYQAGFLAALAGRGAREGVQAVVEHHRRWPTTRRVCSRCCATPPIRGPGSRARCATTCAG